MAFIYFSISKLFVKLIITLNLSLSIYIYKYILNQFIRTSRSGHGRPSICRPYTHCDFGNYKYTEYTEMRLSKPIPSRWWIQRQLLKIVLLFFHIYY